MEHRERLVFLSLILAQGAHSIEEYVAKLYDVFAPARFVSGLVSQDLALGFLVVNAALVTFGLWCWAVPVRSGWQAARGFAWFWTILELGNGIGHLALAFLALAFSRGGYFPGAGTAPHFCCSLVGSQSASDSLGCRLRLRLAQCSERVKCWLRVCPA